MSGKETIKRIEELDVVGIRTEDFQSYLNMWVVVVDGRLFARSWSKSESSWFWAFKSAGRGLMLVDQSEYKVEALEPEANDTLHLAINSAYQTRYGGGEASRIAEAMQARSRWSMTMEFKLIT